jgi:hypothetical protein
VWLDFCGPTLGFSGGEVVEEDLGCGFGRDSECAGLREGVSSEVIGGG